MFIAAGRELIAELCAPSALQTEFRTSSAAAAAQMVTHLQQSYRQMGSSNVAIPSGANPLLANHWTR